MKTAKLKKDGSYILKLSASRVDTYDKCALKYYFTYLDKLPRKEWDHFDLGTLVHGTLEIFHAKFRNDDQRPDKIRSHMSKSFKEQVNIMNRKHSLKPTIVEEARTLLRGYLKELKMRELGQVFTQLRKRLILIWVFLIFMIKKFL